MAQPAPFLVVIGASIGGVDALMQIAAGLPSRFAAPICVVLHVGANPSMLPQLLSASGPLRAVHAHEDQRMSAATIYVAPPDHHLLVDRDWLRLTRGPKENHSRPALDPLFRSAAATWGARVIGVVLTGRLDDGTAGLAAVKDCGGLALVQDPDTAVEPGMPLSALENVAVDERLDLADIAPRLVQLVGRAAPDAGAPSARVTREYAINRGEDAVENLQRIAHPSSLTCPDCGGTLWEVAQSRPLRYRCHTGHAFTARTLEQAQADTAEQSLWGGARVLQERAMLLRRMAGVSRATGSERQAQLAEQKAAQLTAQVQQIAVLAQVQTMGDDDAGA